MNELSIVTSLERLTPGYSVIVYQPDEFDECALIECKRKRTQITLLDDIEADNTSSKIIKAFQDEKVPTFSIDNDVLNSILNNSSLIMEELIALFAYHQDISQKVVDVLMEKIAQLSNVYSPEYIISEIRKFSLRDFENFIETDDTYTFFKRIVQ